jgi:hypothetical protein
MFIKHSTPTESLSYRRLFELAPATASSDQQSWPIERDPRTLPENQSAGMTGAIAVI